MLSGWCGRILVVAFAVCAFSSAQSPDQVLIVINERSPVSREIGEYYAVHRGIPRANICTIGTAPQETIVRSTYDGEIEAPVGAFLKKRGLQEKILYIVLTSGVPLRISGKGDELQNDAASVDSELTLLYQRLRSVKIPLPGPIGNPFFRHPDSPFRHPTFPIYLVTRLDGYDMADMKGLVDRALLAKDKGKFVIDLKGSRDQRRQRMAADRGIAAPERPCRARRIGDGLVGHSECDRLCVMGIERHGPEDAIAAFRLAARSDRDRVCFVRRPDFPSASCEVGDRHVGRPADLVCRRAANTDRRLHS